MVAGGAGVEWARGVTDVLAGGLGARGVPREHESTMKTALAKSDGLLADIKTARVLPAAATPRKQGA